MSQTNDFLTFACGGTKSDIRRRCVCGLFVVVLDGGSRKQDIGGPTCFHGRGVWTRGLFAGEDCCGLCIAGDEKGVGPTFGVSSMVT